MRVIRAGECRVMPWKNGGGITTEIAMHPPGASLDTFDWRLSMAHVGTDGPFSSFPGIDRTLAVLAGEGIALTSEEAGTVTLQRESTPYSFPGEWGIKGRLVDGPIDDLNVMTRRGRWQHRMQKLPATGPHRIDSDDGLLVVVARTGSWEVQGRSDRITLEAGGTLIVPAPDHVEINGPSTGDLFAIRLWPSA